MKLRDQQTGALRRGYVATRLCEALELRGHTATFSPSNGVIQATDEMGRTSRLQLGADGLPEAYTSPAGRSSKLRYSDEGLLRHLVEPSGRRTTLQYDAQGAPLSFGRDDVELAKFAWSSDYSQSRLEFWDGSRAYATYSAASKPLQHTNRVGATETFEYDDENRLTSLVDGAGNRTRFSYDVQSRSTTTRYSDGRIETAQYDAEGRWTGTLLNGRQLLRTEVNARSRPVSADYADGRKETFEYDDQGRLIGAAGPDGALGFAYDQAGRPSAETSDGQTFKLEYDKTGLLTSIEYPGGVRAVYGYDADKRLVSVNFAGAVWTFAYDREDQQVWTTLSNQLSTVTRLSPSGKPARVTTSDLRSRSTCFGTQYQYDLQDRLSARNDTELGVSQYVYDSESQLVGVANGAGRWRETFAYDGAGNRVATSGQAVAVDAGNRLLSQGELRCKYDRQGNIVRISDARDTWRFQYDLKNQMTRAEGPAGVVTFKYDAIGRRIEKKTADRTIRYQWCGEAMARETIETKDGKSVREYLYRPASYEPLGVRIDGRCYFYHNDHQGTPQRLTDDQGRVVWSADYFAFGYAQVKVELIENSLRFAGQYADRETGLHYNRFRYYSPVLGRYASIDPLRLLPGSNLYQYVRNNPVNKLDGLGLWSVLGVVGVVAAAAAIVVAAPFMLAAAPLIVAGGLLAVEAVSVGKDFCFKCFMEGAAEAFLPGVAMGVAGALVLAGVAAVFSAPVAAVVGVGIGLYFAYEMLDQHFGWSGGKPFDELTPEEKSKSMGRLFGGTVGALLGGLGTGKALGALGGPKGAPIEEGAGKSGGKGAASEGAGESGAKTEPATEGKDPAIEEDPAKTAEEPKPEEPKPEEPKPEEPKPEEPKPEEPKPEQPKPEQPKPEQPKPEEETPEQKRERLKQKRDADRAAKKEKARDEHLDNKIKEADKNGKLEKLSEEDRKFLDEDPRNKKLAIDPDGDGSYRVEEAKTALQAEEDGTLQSPVRRATKAADPSEAGADFVDGKGELWDVKDASQGAKDIASGAKGPPPENILVDTSKLTPAEQAQLESDVQNELGNSTDRGRVEFSPKNRTPPPTEPDDPTP